MIYLPLRNTEINLFAHFLINILCAIYLNGSEIHVGCYIYSVLCMYIRRIITVHMYCLIVWRSQYIAASRLIVWFTANYGCSVWKLENVCTKCKKSQNKSEREANKINSHQHNNDTMLSSISNESRDGSVTMCRPSGSLCNSICAKQILMASIR